MNLRKILLLTTVAAIALLTGYRLHRKSDYLNYPPPARGEWAAFGDSLTEGYGATEGHDYPRLLAKKLGLKILNHGVAGDTTGAALNRLEAVAKLKPRVVLLCLGGNDALQQLSREQMFANLAQIIDRFQQSGSFVVLIGIRGAGLRDKNEAQFEELAREKRVFLVPNLLDGVFLHPDLMSDAVHPNDAGYEHIAERLAELLQPLLPKLGPP